MNGLIELWNRLPPIMRGILNTLLTAALSGGAAAISGVTLDPEHFNMQELHHVTMLFAFGAIVGVINWVRQAPWKKTDPNVVSRNATVGMILALILGGAMMTSCASSQAVHVATVVDTGIANTLHQVKVDEGKVYRTGAYAKEKHNGYLKTIRQADQDAIALTDAIDAWRIAGADANSIPAIVSTTKAALQKVLEDLASLPQDNPLVKSLQAAIKALS